MAGAAAGGASMGTEGAAARGAKGDNFGDRKGITAGGEKETVDDFSILERDPHYSAGLAPPDEATRPDKNSRLKE